MSNIPIYRAKKIDSDEYVIGWYLGRGQISRYCATINNDNTYSFRKNDLEDIDILTLSIHFPDMLDSEGNKIFASLSENGKGGDIIDRVAYQGKPEVIICDKDGFIGTYMWDWLALKNEKIKVIEIKQ